jgi:hypothetical protein
MYTFYSSVIKCNYLYFMIYVIAIVYGAIVVERVCVGRVANLCVARSRMTHLTWTYEIRGSRIIQRILDSLRMMTVACYLMSILCVFRPWFQQRNPVVLRHTDIGRVIGEQRGYVTKIMNGRYTKQTADNTRLSLFLGGFRIDPS